MSMEDYDFLFKIVLIGNAGVGKTCLVRRFTQGLFPPGQGATIGVDFMIKTVEINGEKVKLQIWDTAGQERFRSITQSYYRSANALILTYDITCEESFRCLPEWLREIEQYASNKVITVLVGKPKLERPSSVSVVLIDNPMEILKSVISFVHKHFQNLWDVKNENSSHDQQ
ncbi:hypothetical protein STEG23_005574 [Scotinomys teguina]